MPAFRSGACASTTRSPPRRSPVAPGGQSACRLGFRSWPEPPEDGLCPKCNPIPIKKPNRCHHEPPQPFSWRGRAIHRGDRRAATTPVMMVATPTLFNAVADSVVRSFSIRLIDHLPAAGFLAHRRPGGCRCRHRPEEPAGARKRSRDTARAGRRRPGSPGQTSRAAPGRRGGSAVLHQPPSSIRWRCASPRGSRSCRG